MQKRINREHSRLTEEDAASLVAALEPSQLAAAKAQTHFPRRKLTFTQMVLFWALRLYLVLMVAVVVFQIWTVAR